jgi:phenylalanyl-tRNA synthetase beta chain
VPTHRHYDVTREADLIEEVGRLHGFDRLPRTLPEHGDRVGILTREQLLRRRAEDVMRDLGFDEIVSWSFVAPDLPDRLRVEDGDPLRQMVSTHNPLSEEHSSLRTTLLGGLLDAARHNLARDVERAALFESGRAFLRERPPAEGGPAAGRFAGELDPPVCEPHRVACLAVGPLVPPGWRGTSGPAGFYELKGVLEALCGQLDVPVRLSPVQMPFLHPGRSAAVEIGPGPAGWLGELHPLVAREWDLPGGAGFEVDVAPLVEAASSGHEQYEDVTTYPALYQDIAVTVAEDIPAERVRQQVLEAGGELLRMARVFDLYSGEQVGEGRKSLALRLEFRAPDHTLTDEEVAQPRQAIEEALGEIGGALRE